MARRRARELAFRTLFQSERGASPLLEVWYTVRSEALESDDEADEDTAYGEPLDTEGLDFAGELLKLFEDNRGVIDAALTRSVEGWTFAQMSQTDLNVLRLAATEMRFTDTPAPVVIEMAVRLAKKFGGEESGRFVNGVLAKLLRDPEVSDGG
ncbi:MAG: transcription antitermination factor NusB [Trueperaceae bacterium]|nr:transcription antitermination factor NusB [Trueperaceae bacterium]